MFTDSLDDGEGAARVQADQVVVLEERPDARPQLPLHDLPDGAVEHVLRQQLWAQPVQQNVKHLKKI